MKEYTIEYHTQNIYEGGAKEGHFELMIIPCNSDTQKLQKMEFFHSLDGQFFFGTSKYNFETLHVRTEKSFSRFDLQFKAQVQKFASDFNLWNGLHPIDEMEMLKQSDFYIQYHPFLHLTPLTDLPFSQIPIDLKKLELESLGTYLNRLNCEIKEFIQYQPGETTTQTTAQQALQQGKGVCQDFSHIMVGILRKQNIPARYVSGYLHIGNHAQGAQLHAWVEAYIPNLGWRAFDPANQLMEDEQYIKIAHGRDYTDCQSIKGVLMTYGNNQTHYQIKIKSNTEEQFSAQQQQQTQKMLYF
jgi:hypothetical protein